MHRAYGFSERLCIMNLKIKTGKEKTKDFFIDLWAFYKEFALSGGLASVLLGAAIVTFGVYNIHQQTGVTEGGILGLILLIQHWTGVYPSVLVPILDGLAYAFALRYLGKDFLKVSLVATVSFSLFFKLWEMFPPILPDLSNHLLLAAIIGGIFVGVGCGLVVRQGGSGSGDDALALTISKLAKCRISHAYLVTDLSVLLLSLSYIAMGKMVFSLITVLISSFLVEFVQNFNRKSVETVVSR